jgi:uncharacterized protein YebE (UPF0316 family)
VTFLKKIVLPKDKQSKITGTILLENGKLLIIANNEKKKEGGFWSVNLHDETEARAKNTL